MILSNYYTIYTDGTCSGNPGPGGYGIVIFNRYKIRKELSGGFRKTTNNRMELLASIIALEFLSEESKKILFYSDSKYVVDAVEKKWCFKWQEEGFKNKKNEDLWNRFLKIYMKYHIQFEWIKGHNGNFENERCDELAKAAIQKSYLPPDEWYERYTNFNNDYKKI